MNLDYIGQLFLAMFLVLESLYLFSLFNKNTRNSVKMANNVLEELRTKAVKTVEEQKLFINIKYPKKPPFKWEWKVLPSFLLSSLKFIGLFIIFSYILRWTGITFWWSLTLVFALPFICNIILRKFGLNGGDMTDIFFKAKKKKGDDEK